MSKDQDLASVYDEYFVRGKHLAKLAGRFQLEKALELGAEEPTRASGSPRNVAL